jgi:hypothetical protein
MDAGQPKQWIKGRIGLGQEFLIAAIPKDSPTLYVLTALAGAAVARDTGGIIGSSSNVELALEPRLAQAAETAARFRFARIDDGRVQIRRTAPEAGYLSATPIGSRDVARVSTVPAALALHERTGIALDELRAEGRYTLATAAGGAVFFWRLLPTSIPDVADVQQTVRGIPYVDLLSSEDANLMLIPTTLYERARPEAPEAGLEGRGDECAQVKDLTTILRVAAAHLARAESLRAEAPFRRFYVSAAECRRGAWYALCYGGNRCGRCYGKCPGDATCSVVYDRVNRRLTYGCSRPANEVPWYETWWILLLIAVAAIAFIVIILMVIHYSSHTKPLETPPPGAITVTMP